LKTGRIGSFSPWASYEVLQLIDKKTAIVVGRSQGDISNFFLISEDVADMQEGRELGTGSGEGLSGSFLVEGKRKYATANGSFSTIPVVRRYDLV
jgi:hypothetical protein